MNTSWLEGKVIIVTGGASGIGRAIVEEAADSGAIAVIADVNEEMGTQLVEQLTGAGRRAQFITCDVTKADQVQSMVEEAATLGDIGFLANSAGLQTYGTVETTSEELWDKTMNVNLKSMYLTAHEVIPHLKKNGGGAIVNISSIQGIRSQRNGLCLCYFQSRCDRAHSLYGARLCSRKYPGQLYLSRRHRYTIAALWRWQTRTGRGGPPILGWSASHWQDWHTRRDCQSRSVSHESGSLLHRGSVYRGGWWAWQCHFIAFSADFSHMQQ